MEWALILVSVGIGGSRHPDRPPDLGRAVGLAQGEAWARRFPTVHRVLANKYYVDELYDATVVRGTWALARLLSRFDAAVIDGLVNFSRHFTVVTALLSGFFDRYVVDGLVNLVGYALSQSSCRVPAGADRSSAAVRPGGRWPACWRCWCSPSSSCDSSRE